MTKLQKILHVDDDEDIRTITRMSLELVGKFEVYQCGSGHQALKEAKTFAPDLFLLDVMMPEMDGVETWHKLLEIPALYGTPTIFMTAKAEDTTSRSLLDAGAIAVVTKPFDPMKLPTQLHHAWDKVQA